MRPVFFTTAAAFLLTASAGVLPWLAPAALADNGVSSFELIQDMQRQKEEIRQLRGKIELLEHQIERNRISRQEMYERLDERLKTLKQALEEGGGNARANDEAAEKAYLAAFEQMRNGKYDAAVSEFEAFNEKYPNSAYSDNAWYWLGQARYVQGDLDGAMQALRTVIDDYPDSDKVPSSLFRMGVIKLAQGQSGEAQSLFRQVISDYPEDKAAEMAREQLEEMSG